MLLVLGLTAGQVISVPFAAGARVTLLDLSVVVLLLMGAYLRGKKRFIPALWAPIIGFLGVSLLSLVLTLGNVPLYVVGGGLMYILRWIMYASIYWVAASSLVAPGMWRSALTASGIATAALGLIQYFLYPDLRNLVYLGWDPHYQRLFSTLLDPNFTGIILAATIVSLLGMWEAKKNTQIALLGSIVVTLSAFILTYSRSSFVAFVFGMIMWGILSRKKAITLGVLIVSLCAVLVLPSTGEGRNLLRTASSFARIGNAERAISLIIEKPILGHGFNILRFVSIQRSWINENDAPSRSGAGLDTSILFVGATTGFIGMVVYGWLIISLFGKAMFAYIDAKKSRPFIVTYISILCMTMVHSLFINSLFYPWVMVWMWVLTGVLEQKIRADR